MSVAEMISATLNRRAVASDACNCARCQERAAQLAPTFRCTRCGYHGAPMMLEYRHDEETVLYCHDAPACPICLYGADADAAGIDAGGWPIVRTIRELMRSGA